jgi:hypothetical protein
MGVREHVGAGLLVMGISLGGLLNAGNWTVYRVVLGLDTPVVSSYALSLFVLAALGAVLFLAVELWRTGSLRPRLRLSPAGLALLAVAAVIGLGLRRFAASGGDIGAATRLLLAPVGAALLLAALLRAAGGSRGPGVPLASYAIPLVPLALILVYGMPFVPAFLCGIGYAILTTWHRGIVNATTRAMIEGSASVIPAVVLMVGIGMLLSAILGPTPAGPGRAWLEAHPGAEWPVLTDMKPLLRLIVPGSLAAYVGVFTLLAPLALYRGPLNVWGLGYGVGGVLLATGVPAGAVMGILMSLGMVQGVSDPTNTANVWVANEARLDVTTLMWRTLPYAWLIAAGGLVIAGLRFPV